VFVLFKQFKPSHFYILFALIFVATFSGVLFGTSYYNVKSTYYFNSLPLEYKEGINVLLTASDDGSTSLDYIAVLSMNPQKQTVEITPIQTDTLVKIVDNNHPIKNVYSVGGADMFVQKITELTNMDITFYSFSKFSTLKNILYTYGKLDLNTKKYQKTLVNAKDIFEIIEDIKNNGNTKEKEAFFTNVTKEFVNQKTSGEWTDKTPDLIREFVQNSDTNFKLSDIEIYIAILKSLSKKDVSITDVKGTYSNIDGYTYFIPANDTFKK
jgi:anionic cell wall polymer biosynthesis LytR-Cps2A-Psr (LCP) family protein